MKKEAVMREGNENIILMEAEPEPVEIDLLKSAVIVVDMQNAFMVKGGYFDLIGIDTSAAWKIVEPCREIIRAAREKGARIIYFQMGYSPDLSDAGSPDSPGFQKSSGLNFFRKHPELKEKLYFYGGWGAEIIEELKPLKEAIVIRKQKYDGLIGTNLDVILRSLGIRHLLFLVSRPTCATTGSVAPPIATSPPRWIHRPSRTARPRRRPSPTTHPAWTRPWSSRK